MKMVKGDVVQFVESHKWIGCLGAITEVRDWGYTVGVPIPERGVAYIRVKEHDIEYVGKARLVEVE